MSNKYQELENNWGYKFKNISLLETAITHRSFSKNNNEKLEFIGDAILSAIVADFLYKNFSKESEGDLANRLGFVICSKSIVTVAKEINIGKFLILENGEEQTGGRKRISNLENALEALIGATYLDSNFELVKSIVIKHWEAIIRNYETPPKDFKSKLQEIVQSRYKNYLPEYKIISKEGSDHEPIFTIELKIHNLDPVYSKGKTKKEAEMKAAEIMLAIISNK